MIRRLLPIRTSPVAVLVAATTALAMLAVPASAAPFKWRDANGRMVYSDLPPPPGARVTLLSAPARAAPMPAAADTAGTSSGAAAAGDAAGASSTAPAASGAPPGGDRQATAQPASWIEREKASRLKAIERDEAERKRADEARKVAERARLCEEARTSLRTLESGIRLRTVDDRGEQVVIDDAERERRAETMRRTIAEHCGTAG